MVESCLTRYDSYARFFRRLAIKGNTITEKLIQREHSNLPTIRAQHLAEEHVGVAKSGHHGLVKWLVKCPVCGCEFVYGLRYKVIR